MSMHFPCSLKKKKNGYKQTNVTRFEFAKEVRNSNKESNGGSCARWPRGVVTELVPSRSRCALRVRTVRVDNRTRVDARLIWWDIISAYIMMFTKRSLLVHLHSVTSELK